MRDQRVTKLAKILVHHSCQVKPGENVLIDIYGDDRDLARELVKEVYQAGGFPFVQLNDQKIQRSLLLGTSEEHLKRWTDLGVYQMGKMNGYIAVRGSNNISELSDVPDEQMGLYSRIYYHQVHSELRVKKTKWVVLRYPNESMAQLANMSTEAFEDFYFDVCTLDYQYMDEVMEPLKKRMEQTDQVRIVGPGTDLTFSIKGIPVIKCSGQHNIPDGEIFTAPVLESVNGVITFNAPTIYHGTTFENIRLELDNGRIVKATANETEKLNKILDTDNGARYIGEFSLGLNPYILHPMKDILFDEKITGSFHFTPGQAYEEADNGNRSAIHWDLVCIQRPEYGGGEIYFDGELIRKDGQFVVEDLLPLNPENLKK
ncbi:aminopeptidase [Thermoflavimicrobium dichotomicum]|uniref:Aminopeptidase n=1 Tax=Thermoflavimicrobium dichotomicum TaxID=46223 RepID=A0A1I3MMA6_9BACL|nr:aminopeptidase [Thermoflavimicrobium dichotomicum]SFI98127.1 aminopeptidase [Thermoflavimicrobium dichotomicum]